MTKTKNAAPPRGGCYCFFPLSPSSMSSMDKSDLPHLGGSSRRSRRRPQLSHDKSDLHQSTASSSSDGAFIFPIAPDSSNPKFSSSSLFIIHQLQTKGMYLCRHAISMTVAKSTTGIDSSGTDAVTSLPLSFVYDDSLQLVPKSSNVAIASTEHASELFRLIRQEIIGAGKYFWPLSMDDGHNETSTQTRKVGDANKLDDDQSILEASQTHDLVIPIATSSIEVEPLQSIVLRKVNVHHENFHGDNEAGDYRDDSDDDNDPLLRSCWKRQMVGMVIASSTTWTTRIRLCSRQSSNGSDSFNDIMDTTNFDVESFTVRTTFSTTTSPRHRPSDDKIKFYSIFPSTIITIVFQSTTPTTTPPTNQHNPDMIHPSELGSTRPPTCSLPPPSDTARRLLETVKCMALRRPTTGTSVSKLQTNNSHDIPRTFLLSGPPGCGKTYSVQWVVDESNRLFGVKKKKKNVIENHVILCSVRGSELLHQNHHTSPAQALKHLFEMTVLKLKSATREHRQRFGENSITPVGLIFLDECDALVSVDSMAAMLAGMLDRISGSTDRRGNQQNDPKNYWQQLIVVGATNLIDSMPSFLRRAGRFDCEIPMSPPSAETRAKLLRSLLSTLTPAVVDEESSEEERRISDEELKAIADACVGYVPADLTALVRKAWLNALQQLTGRTDESGSSSTICVSYYDLEMARHEIAPSALRGALLSAPPKVSWDDIAGDPGGAKTALRQAIEWPRSKSKEYKMLGLQAPRGILLHGPPGCGKTSLARAAAGATGVAFLSLSPAQVYASSYVGEAESIIRRSFALARSASPCILFFDEIDSLFGGTSDNGGGTSGRGSSAEARVLSTFLNEMDGVDIAKEDGVLVLGGTNRPWSLDSALLRPGRLGDKIIYLPPPDEMARRALFEKHFSMPVGHDVVMSWDWESLIRLSTSMTGAEIVGACLQAKTRWLKQSLQLAKESKSEERSNEYSATDFPLPSSSLFGVESILISELRAIKPMLSNPDAVDEFRLFGHKQT